MAFIYYRVSTIHIMLSIRVIIINTVHIAVKKKEETDFQAK